MKISKFYLIVCKNLSVFWRIRIYKKKIKNKKEIIFVIEIAQRKRIFLKISLNNLSLVLVNNKLKKKKMIILNYNRNNKIV